MSKLHNPDNLMRDKDRDFLGDDGHYWFSFLCPSESRAGEHHRHVYQVRDDGAVAYCACPYATNGGACTLILCARDVARQARAVDEPPPADPGGAALDAAQDSLDGEQADWRHDALVQPERADVGHRADASAAVEPLQAAQHGRPLVGRRTAPDQAPTPALPRPDALTLDALVAAGGGRWLVSRTPPRVTLTCPACHHTLVFLSEDSATSYLAGYGRCRCGGGGPTPPAHGAARKPIGECLADLYGEAP